MFDQLHILSSELTSQYKCVEWATSTSQFNWYMMAIMG